MARRAPPPRRGRGRRLKLDEITEPVEEAAEPVSVSRMAAPSARRRTVAAPAKPRLKVRIEPLSNAARSRLRRQRRRQGIDVVDVEITERRKSVLESSGALKEWDSDNADPKQLGAAVGRLLDMLYDIDQGGQLFDLLNAARHS